MRLAGVSFIAALAATALPGLPAYDSASHPAPGSASAAVPAVLRVGDQRGSTRAILEAAGELGGAPYRMPYRIEWSLFLPSERRWSRR